ncbi:PREDICTED: basic salivary proline-rich protein 3-like [Cyprinodon variegatus]|uniref:basic salivary proline-rich protein 3-like n=1 Tax=Cyprinodon variegatus TaxID=28743 RepID=UPI000742B422|nr:PREDICTED: basic salivary proline-rich protein 3-like [Cyprinodon variegatus]
MEDKQESEPSLGNKSDAEGSEVQKSEARSEIPWGREVLVRAQQAPRHPGTPEAMATGADSRAYTGPDPKQFSPQNPNPRNPTGAPAQGQRAPGIPDPRTHPRPTQQRSSPEKSTCLPSQETNKPAEQEPLRQRTAGTRGPERPQQKQQRKADMDEPMAPTKPPGRFPHPKTQRNHSAPTDHSKHSRKAKQSMEQPRLAHAREPKPPQPPEAGTSSKKKAADATPPRPVRKQHEPPRSGLAPPTGSREEDGRPDGGNSPLGQTRQAPRSEHPPEPPGPKDPRTSPRTP